MLAGKNHDSREDKIDDNKGSTHMKGWLLWLRKINGSAMNANTPAGRGARNMVGKIFKDDSGRCPLSNQNRTGFL
jgi:hypothetical protein